ncbi:hypothetical protein C8J55DRAFT_606361 [Lentinula edodes]|uniref:Uncharacterized protein n=1 Tax=Lentinula lateritia TaxID=40482 RepID=A0A9W9AB45_9AGAR|nr:hypothetical protein C8J55DRAFT_606361 [Lentinula edodes]
MGDVTSTEVTGLETFPCTLRRRINRRILFLSPSEYHIFSSTSFSSTSFSSTSFSSTAFSSTSFSSTSLPSQTRITLSAEEMEIDEVAGVLDPESKAKVTTIHRGSSAEPSNTSAKESYQRLLRARCPALLPGFTRSRWLGEYQRRETGGWSSRSWKMNLRTSNRRFTIKALFEGLFEKDDHNDAAANQSKHIQAIKRTYKDSDNDQEHAGQRLQQ